MRIASSAVVMALAGLVGASAADGALAQLGGGSGLSGTLSANKAIRRQQLICDPAEPQLGSTSVSYDATKVTLTGYAIGPGYFLDDAFVEVSDSQGQRLLQFITSFLSSPAGTETGYVQVSYGQNGTAGQISPAGPDGSYVLRADNPGITGVGAADTHALYFDLLSPLPTTTVATYRVYAAQGNTHSGNQPDFFSVPQPDGSSVRVEAADIKEVSVSGDFLPEPSTMAVGAMAAAGLLLKRRRSRRGT
jgi:hypothetical protein